jgi:hypothetical protein
MNQKQPRIREGPKTNLQKRPPRQAFLQLRLSPYHTSTNGFLHFVSLWLHYLSAEGCGGGVGIRMGMGARSTMSPSSSFKLITSGFAFVVVVAAGGATAAGAGTSVDGVASKSSSTSILNPSGLPIHVPSCVCWGWFERRSGAIREKGILILGWEEANHDHHCARPHPQT